MKRKKRHLSRKAEKLTNLLRFATDSCRFNIFRFAENPNSAFDKSTALHSSEFPYAFKTFSYTFLTYMGRRLLDALASQGEPFISHPLTPSWFLKRPISLLSHPPIQDPI